MKQGKCLTATKGTVQLHNGGRSSLCSCSTKTTSTPIGKEYELVRCNKLNVSSNLETVPTMNPSVESDFQKSILSLTFVR